jgi:hypothetical protein
MTQIKKLLSFIVEHGLGRLYKWLMGKRGEGGGRNKEMLDKTE